MSIQFKYMQTIVVAALAITACSGNSDKAVSRPDNTTIAHESRNISALEFNADSDALIVKGIISMLLKVLSGHTPQEIMNADLYFIDKIGLAENLSPTRSNGLAALLKQMRLYAIAYNAKENSR